MFHVNQSLQDILSHKFLLNHLQMKYLDMLEHSIL